MNPLLFLILFQIQRAKVHIKDVCERHLISDNPYDEAEYEERLRTMRLLSPESFRGKDD